MFYRAYSGDSRSVWRTLQWIQRVTLERMAGAPEGVSGLLWGLGTADSGASGRWGMPYIRAGVFSIGGTQCYTGQWVLGEVLGQL